MSVTACAPGYGVSHPCSTCFWLNLSREMTEREEKLKEEAEKRKRDEGEPHIIMFL